MSAAPRRISPLAIVATVAVALYALFCSVTGLLPRCPLKMLTGLQCPGCGSQRAFYALLHGRFAESWSYNLLLPLLLLYTLAVVLLPLLPWKPARRIHSALTSVGAMIGLLAVIVAWWIIRNILGI